MNYETVTRALATIVVTTIVSGLSQYASPQAEPQSEELEARQCDRDVNADCTSFGRGGIARVPIVQSRDGAPVDLTGVWVSVVTEDWRWRMMTPPKGDYASLPLSDEGVRVADLWDPERDADTCKHFGAAGLMRNPMRLRISWEDDKTLRIDTDHGLQTRLLHFDRSAIEGGASTLQGDSLVEWSESGLRVVTTNLSPGYLRKNGVPYSGESTQLTEHFDRLSSVFGDEWLLVTTVVVDPIYLTREFITSTHFKKLPDDSSWNPVPCGS
jgi:hypothetical protein